MDRWPIGCLFLAFTALPICGCAGPQPRLLAAESLSRFESLDGDGQRHAMDQWSARAIAGDADAFRDLVLIRSAVDTEQAEYLMRSIGEVYRGNRGVIAAAMASEPLDVRRSLVYDLAYAAHTPAEAAVAAEWACRQFMLSDDPASFIDY